MPKRKNDITQEEEYCPRRMILSKKYNVVLGLLILPVNFDSKGHFCREEVVGHKINGFDKINKLAHEE